jgi:hypothetical protein
MAQAPDDIIVTGPAFAQEPADNLLITPPGGTQGKLANFVNGGTIAQTLLSPLLGGIPQEAVTSGITASTTQTLAGAVPLTTAVNVISTVATANNAVKLAPVSLNTGYCQVQIVINNGASAASIFPYETATAIDSHSTAAAATLTNGHSAFFFQNTPSTWVSIGSTTQSA